jgi:hypothetical protein
MKRLALIALLALAACQTDAPAPLPPVGEAKVAQERAACEARGGQFRSGGKSGGLICFTTPRDAGKQCTRASQCDSGCLARSQTCAPIKPLFGCNEILTDDGQRVTQCID